MVRANRLGLGEFLTDIAGVIRAPRRRFPMIHDRGAVWGSLVLLILPSYFALGFAGALYFRRDPFPGYAFLLPAVLASALTLLKLLSIHVVAHLLERRVPHEGVPGTFRDLVVVFGYTGIPANSAPLIALIVFLTAPEQAGYLLHSFRAVTISILIAIGISLFIWNVILMVLALRVVYRLGDLKILLSIFAGPLIVGALPGFAAHTIFAEPKSQLANMRPILSERMTRFLTADLSGERKEVEVSVHVDRIAYRSRAPERFDLVAVEPAGNGSGTQKEAPVLVGRIVGVPGDTVELAGSKLRINGQAWAEPYLVPEYQSAASVPETRLPPSNYLVLPEDRRLVDSRRRDLVVPRGRILGRVMIGKWPFGWWWFRPSAFLQPYPVPE